MNLLKIIILLTAICFSCFCTVQITRIGYSIDENKKYNNNCDIHYFEYACFDTLYFDKLGTVSVELTETNSSKSILSLLTKEACALDANIINIVGEYKPQMNRTHFITKANILRIKIDKNKLNDSVLVDLAKNHIVHNCLKNELDYNNVVESGNPVYVRAVLIQANNSLFLGDSDNLRAMIVFSLDFSIQIQELKKIADIALSLKHMDTTIENINSDIKLIAKEVTNEEYNPGKFIKVPLSVCGNDNTYISCIWIDKNKLKKEYLASNIFLCIVKLVRGVPTTIKFAD